MEGLYTPLEIQHVFLKSKSPKFPKRLPFPNHHLFTIYIKFGRVFCNSQTLRFSKVLQSCETSNASGVAQLWVLPHHIWLGTNAGAQLVFIISESSRMAKFGMVKWKLSKNDILSHNHQICWIISDRIQYQCDYNRYSVYVYIMCIYIIHESYIYIALNINFSCRVVELYIVNISIYMQTTYIIHLYLYKWNENSPLWRTLMKIRHLFHHPQLFTHGTPGQSCRT